MKIRVKIKLDTKADLERYSEHSEEPSMAVPNQSFTCRELISRFQAGTLPPVRMQGVWDDNPNIDDPCPMADPAFDLTDADEIKRDLERKVRRSKKSVDNATDLSPAPVSTQKETDSVPDGNFKDTSSQRLENVRSKERSE